MRGLLNKFLLGAAALVVSSHALAERMDSEIHTIVIEKLEVSLNNAKNNETVNLRPVRQRLADLYADRARLRTLEEGAKNCTNCTGALNDRRRALELYEQVAKEANKKQRGHYLLQAAHLYELTEKFDRAEAIYERLIREGRGQHDKVVMTSAFIGRGERRFQKGKMQLAQNDFEQALRTAENYQKGRLQHRIAWCQLNKGEQKQAVRSLVKILKNPALLTRITTRGEEQDPTFQEDVAKDLATFVARGNVTKADIQMVDSFTPQRTKLENLKHFANECDRLGQKPAAINVWAIALRYETNDLERLEAMIRITQIRYDLGQKDQSIADMKGSIEFWNKKGCTDKEKCEALKIRLRKLVIEWNRAEKKDPSRYVLEAYLVYLSKFDDDLEMTHWAAEVARKTEKYKTAVALYHKSSLLAAAQKNQVALESSTVGEVEMAELVKDKAMRESAYVHYMQINPNGAISEKVHYQYAHVAYERGESREASNRFYDFMRSKHCANRASSDLCVQAADLDLDALVLLRDHPTVEKRATEYSRIVPQRRNEYLKIARTSILKQAEGEADPARALAKLNDADLTGASSDERIKFQKTRLAYAEKAQDVAETRRSAESLLRVQGLEPEDREFALGKVLWAAEATLDFETAYSTAKKMKMPRLSEADREMKLALLAELAHRNSRPHEEKFLRLSKDGGRKALVRAKFVRKSSKPARELAKHDSELRRYPQVYAQVALEIFARTGDRRFAEKALKVRGVSSDPAGRVLAQQLFLRDIASFDKEIGRHRLRTGSDAAVQKSLAQRLDLMSQAERGANIAIANKDWTAQILTLTTLSRENERLYNDIFALPVPKKLKGAQREKYKKAVEQQASVYLVKHNEIEKKLKVLWSDSDAAQALAQDYKQSRPEVRPLLAYEIRQLNAASATGLPSELASAVADGGKGPSSTEVAGARANAARDPFDAAKLASLRELELGRGNDAMVTFLDSRIMKLESKGVVKR